MDSRANPWDHQWSPRLNGNGFNQRSRAQLRTRTHRCFELRTPKGNGTEHLGCTDRFKIHGMCECNERTRLHNPSRICPNGSDAARSLPIQLSHTRAHATHTHHHTHARPHARMHARMHTRARTRMQERTRKRARTHAHSHARTHARAHARTHTRTHARTHARMHARTHARTHARAHTHTQTNTHPHTHESRQACIQNTHAHAYTHAHVRTHTNMCTHRGDHTTSPTRARKCTGTNRHKHIHDQPPKNMCMAHANIQAHTPNQTFVRTHMRTYTTSSRRSR